MSYQVLARKWRPRIFREMVGQEHVLRALINALDNNRLHHAYLFTGTRGIGKTTIARILAKCLNCERGVSSEPCGECDACLEIAEGRCVDLLEVDAASRTKVEDTRELLDNVQYAPTRARYKVYLIDEVHMLSSHSFNALLKTLEEPPPHVKFLLATTDPQKLPATVLSRCLQFNLKNMSAEQVVSHLQYVLGQEQIDSEDAALWLLGRAAAGSMRDALSLTDQAIAYGSGSLHEDDVRTMLGTIDLSFVYQLLEAAASGDPAACLAVVTKMAEHAPDFEAALDELISLIHRVAMAQAVPDAIDNSWGDAERVAALAAAVNAEDAQLYYQIAINGKRDMVLAADARAALEMILLRMIAFRPAATVEEGAGAVDERAKKPLRPGSDSGSVAQAGHNTLGLNELTPANWPQHLSALGLNGILQNIASHCELSAVVGTKLSFMLDQNNASLYNKRHSANLCAALQNFYGCELSLDIELGTPQAETPAMMDERRRAERQVEAERAMAEDLVLKQFMGRFDGELDPSSIAPLKPEERP